MDTATKMEAVKTLIAISGDNPDVVGLRLDCKAYSVGDVLPVSRVWDDGHATEAILDGTSCLALTRINKAEQYLHGAKYAYLVSGTPLYEGDDIGERVVADATVVAAVAL